MLDQTSTLNKGYSKNVMQNLGRKTKAFNFNSNDSDLRPMSKESDSRTSTSTPFTGIRNNLNSTEYDGNDNSNLSKEVVDLLDSLKLTKYNQLFSDNGI